MSVGQCVCVLLVATVVQSGVGSPEYDDSFHKCESTSVVHLVDTSIELMNKVKRIFVEVDKCCERPMDCEEVLSCGNSKSGVYDIWPRNRVVQGSIRVYCDMDTNGGAWTVIQRRGDFGHSKDNFFQNWNTYKVGFGDVEQDFWLGNDNIYAITNQRQYSIRFDLKDLEGERRFATYDYFWIDNEDLNYTLHVKGYSGDAGNSLDPQAGKQFSTKDRDNDVHPTANCAANYKGAWWFAACHSSNLNGLYYKGYHNTWADGVNWRGWKGLNYSLPWTEMKVRPLSFKYSFKPSYILPN